MIQATPTVEQRKQFVPKSMVKLFLCLSRLASGEYVVIVKKDQDDRINFRVASLPPSGLT